MTYDSYMINSVSKKFSRLVLIYYVCLLLSGSRYLFKMQLACSSVVITFCIISVTSQAMFCQPTISTACE